MEDIDPEEDIHLSNNRMRVTLSSNREGRYLHSVSDRKRDLDLVRGSPEDPLWTLSFRDDKEIKEVSSSGLPASARRNGEAFEIIWDSLDVNGIPATVRVRGEIDTGEGLRLEFESRFGKGARLWEVQFPMVSGLQGKGNLYAPWGYGKSMPFDEDLEYEGRYPSHRCNMQFLSWNIDSSSLYLGCHDPENRTKHLIFGRGPMASFKLPVPDMGPDRRSFSLPYSSLVDIVDGNWYDVASRYRRWAVKRKWCSAGPLHRREIPGGLNDICLWCRTSGEADDVVPDVLEFAEFFEVPVALHWYIWHRIPFDDHYPEYFPPKPGFRRGVERLVKAGIRVMPYINARLWDPGTDSWKNEEAQKAATKKPDGSTYSEVYGSGVPLSPMCPQTQLWRNKIKEIVSELAREYGVSGVYLDQIAAAAPSLCLDEEHGHPLGGGAYWVAGYRKMLEEIGEELSPDRPDFFITTESNAEPWNDLLHALLMCNSTEGQLVPMYPAVYGDLILLFGAYIFPEDLEKVWPFRSKVSQMFLWGTQLGWLGPDILKPGFRSEAEYLKSLAKTRLRGKEFLTYGRMLRPPETDSSTITTTWKLWDREWKIRVPVAGATTWRSPSGQIGLAACNMGDVDTELGIGIPIERSGLSADRAREICRNEDLDEENPQLSGQRLHLELDMESRSARILNLG